VNCRRPVAETSDPLSSDERSRYAHRRPSCARPSRSLLSPPARTSPPTLSRTIVSVPSAQLAKTIRSSNAVASAPASIGKAPRFFHRPRLSPPASCFDTRRRTVATRDLRHPRRPLARPVEHRAITFICFVSTTATPSLSAMFTNTLPSPSATAKQLLCAKDYPLEGSTSAGGFDLRAPSFFSLLGVTSISPPKP
jgi:hypothetical protein